MGRRGVRADDFARLLRAHARAIHALAGKIDYPKGEQQAEARWAIDTLAEARTHEAGALIAAEIDRLNREEARRADA